MPIARNKDGAEAPLNDARHQILVHQDVFVINLLAVDPAIGRCDPTRHFTGFCHLFHQALHIHPVLFRRQPCGFHRCKFFGGNDLAVGSVCTSAQGPMLRRKCRDGSVISISNPAFLIRRFQRVARFCSHRYRRCGQRHSWHCASGSSQLFRQTRSVRPAHTGFRRRCDHRSAPHPDGLSGHWRNTLLHLKSFPTQTNPDRMRTRN